MLNSKIKLESATSNKSSEKVKMDRKRVSKKNESKIDKKMRLGFEKNPVMIKRRKSSIVDRGQSMKIKMMLQDVTRECDSKAQGKCHYLTIL